MVNSDKLAAALAELVERSKASGRPGSDHDLAEVLEQGLDRYALARLYLVATHRLGRSPIPEHPYEWLRTSPSRWTPERAAELDRL